MKSDGYPEHQAAEQLKRVLRLRQMSKCRSCIQDIREALLQARPYRLWLSVWTYIRRLRAISLLLRLIGWILTALQAGTLVLLTAAVLFAVLPVLAALAAGILLAALLDTRQSLRRIQKRLDSRYVYVFFGSGGQFGEGNIRELSKMQNTAVLVVSPFWISSKGLGKSRFYLNLRQESEHLYLIRRYFYFSLRKRVLKPTSTALVY